MRLRLARGFAAVGAIMATLLSTAAPALAVGEVYGPYMLLPQVDSILSPARCLDNPNSNPNNNVKIILWDCLGGANQRWYNEVRSSTDYWTFNAASQKCLTAQNGRLDNNIPIIQFSCNDGTNERWKYERVGTEQMYWQGEYRPSPVFKIRNVKSGRCLTLKNASDANGTEVLQYDCDAPGLNTWVQLYVG